MRWDVRRGLRRAVRRGLRHGLRRDLRRDDGQTLGIYIVAIAALFFLAFAYFAVGQAAVARNTTQTAADAAALAAARDTRDGVQDDFLAALKAGDVDKLRQLLAGQGMDGAGACAAAVQYADLNHADVGPCTSSGSPPAWTVSVTDQRTVGRSVVKGTETLRATAHATAVVDARCTVLGPDGTGVRFSCDDQDVSVDATAGDFILDLSLFYSVHLTS